VENCFSLAYVENLGKESLAVEGAQSTDCLLEARSNKGVPQLGIQALGMTMLRLTSVNQKVKLFFDLCSRGGIEAHSRLLYVWLSEELETIAS
jgi:hypothetical protein